MYKVGSIAIFGDLHLSDTHRGRHKNYLLCCFSMMRDILDYVTSEKPDGIIITGDMFGVREKSIKSRTVLLEICNWFKQLNILTEGNVFVVRGNHDFGENNEFDFVHGLGLFKTTEDCKYVDMIGESNAVAIRYHLVDYGKEKEPIEFCNEESCENIVVFHNNMKVDGQTNWYPDQKGYNLNTMENWKGCSMAIGGHIHNPSPYLIESQIDGNPISLFYLGNGTRPTYEKNIHNKCWIADFRFEDSGDVAFNTVSIALESAENIFYNKEVIEDLTDEEVAEKLRKEDLDEVLKDLMKYRIADGDPILMIDKLPHTNPRAVSLAKEYIERAYVQLATSRK